MDPNARPALFLDRDGTLIVHKPYLHRPEEVEVIAGVRDALLQARDAGWLLFLFTNQSGVGRGWFTMADVQAVHARMIEALDLGPQPFADICIAPEAPDQPAIYRKPSPRFIRECIGRHQLDPDRCWMVGDTAADWNAGLAAGIHAASIVSDHTTPATESVRLALGLPSFPSLVEFAASLFPSPPGRSRSSD